MNRTGILLYIVYACDVKGLLQAVITERELLVMSSHVLKFTACSFGGSRLAESM